MIYLAVPIKHPDPAIVQARIDAANQVAAQLHDAGLPVFSPASHSEGFIDRCQIAQPWEYWAQIDIPILTACCSVLMVITLDGWKESVGVQAEILTAQEIGMEVVFFRDESGELRLDPDLIEYLKDSLR